MITYIAMSLCSHDQKQLGWLKSHPTAAYCYLNAKKLIPNQRVIYLATNQFSHLTESKNVKVGLREWQGSVQVPKAKSQVCLGGKKLLASTLNTSYSLSLYITATKNTRTCAHPVCTAPSVANSSVIRHVVIKQDIST